MLLELHSQAQGSSIASSNMLLSCSSSQVHLFVISSKHLSYSLICTESTLPAPLFTGISTSLFFSPGPRSTAYSCSPSEALAGSNGCEHSSPVICSLAQSVADFSPASLLFGLFERGRSSQMLRSCHHRVCARVSPKCLAEGNDDSWRLTWYHLHST